MNSIQKAVILLGIGALPLLLLFMHGMGYKGIGVAAVAGIALIGGVVHALRGAR
ncbi:MAG TPA: hypothetical protein VHP37_05685 [Burkholderiales bacterium]|jgi:hypothetical protein|nr:hypothetical protein [Burkholderiales bacterium]